jgi:ubiquinol-cytochrome c reductase cytochrome b subunit
MTAMAAIFDLDHRAHIVHWHFFEMSVANIVVGVALLVVFALALVLRAPARRGPTRVASWLDVFGIATIAALIVTATSGLVLALGGPSWWHFSGVGRFFNSVHLWAVELFFLFLVVHLWAKFWSAAWRGGRTVVWVTGAVGFLAAVPAALTGYLSQQNLDAQWLAVNAKDGLNATGAGAFFNVTNFGQMYSYHVLLVPLAVAALVVGHVLLVRRHGLAPPLEFSLPLSDTEHPAPDAPPIAAAVSAKQGAET